LAYAAYQSRLADFISEQELRSALIRAIESGLDEFRMRTWSNPAHDATLEFSAIRFSDLRNDANLVQSAGLASKGVYLFPTVVTTDGGAKETFKNATSALQELRAGVALTKTQELSRSFAPTTAKINNGVASQTPPKGTLLEASCAIITTLTPLKPAAWPGVNTAIIPDLPFAQLRQFISVFAGLKQQDTGDLMKATRRGASSQNQNSETTDKISAKKQSAPSYRRPRLHAGNYPDAPRDAGVFGAVGLLAAIGRWGRRSQELRQAEEVLEGLATHPLYLISYDAISSARFNHHITRLALEHDLTAIIDALYLDTRLYPDAGSARQDFGKPAFKTFCMMAARFLQSFSAAAFRDFLSFRAEYPQKIKPIFTEYFRSMKPEIVHAAGELGQWINSTADREAEADVKSQEKKTGKSLKEDDRKKKVREKKAKLLVEIESAVLSAKSKEEMLSQVVIRMGRYLGEDAPASARPFIDAVFSDHGISFESAQHLLLAYMRLQGSGKATKPAEVEESQPEYNPLHEND
jgi:hypothetical protein